MKHFAPALVAALLASPAAAEPVEDKNPVENPVSAVPFSGEVSVGYETNYIFRGSTFGEHAPWASVGLNFPVGDSMSLDVGTWYINSTRNPSDFDELDVFAFLNFPVFGLDGSAGGTWYSFPEQGGNTGEVSLGLSKDLGIVELGAFTAHAFNGQFGPRDFGNDGGWYWELRALRSLPLTDRLDLNLGAGLSYTNEFFGSDGWNHTYVRAGLGCHLTANTTLNAYIGGNFALEGLDGLEDDDTFHGGLSLSIGF